MAGPFIRVDAVLINCSDVQSVEPNRHNRGWATVSLTNGRTVDVHRDAGELITDIQTILHDGHGRSAAFR
jgi:hypothetical protein